VSFLKSLVRHYLVNEIRARVKNFDKELVEQSREMQFKFVLNTSDVFSAAVRLSSLGISAGKGDRSRLFNVLLNSEHPSEIEDLERKLTLFTQVEFYGIRVF
jgi:hypothetical protein